jgi:HAD superfamily hydrolase (TIGR01509 family)
MSLSRSRSPSADRRRRKKFVDGDSDVTDVNGVIGHRPVVRAVVWDVDGVLINPYIWNNDNDGGSRKKIFRWSSKVKDDLGIKNHDLLLREIFLCDDNRWSRKVITGMLETKVHLEKVFEKLKIEAVTPEQFIEYWLEHDNGYEKNVLDLVSQVSCDCYIGSNQDKLRANALRSYFDLHYCDSFKGEFYSSDIGHAKPSRDFFLKVEENLNLPAECLLLIDDDKKNLESAAACGWNTIHFDVSDCMDSECSAMSLSKLRKQLNRRGILN